MKIQAHEAGSGFILCGQLLCFKQQSTFLHVPLSNVHFTVNSQRKNYKQLKNLTSCTRLVNCCEVQVNMSGSPQPCIKQRLTALPAAPAGHACTATSSNGVRSHHTPCSNERGHESYTTTRQNTGSCGNGSGKKQQNKSSMPQLVCTKNNIFTETE